MVQPAEEMPDLSRHISKLNAVADRASKWGVLRALLVVVAIQVIALAAPSLFDADNHDARHLGAFATSYGVALLVVAFRPARARTVLPVAVVLSGALLITTVVDLVRGAVPLVNETSHLPELVSVLLVWLLAAPGPRRHTAVDRPRRPMLRVVDDVEPTPESGDGSGDGRHAV